MAAHQDLFGLVHPSGKIGRAPLIGVQFLHKRAVRAHDVVPRRAPRKTEDFIGFILGHAARPPRSVAPRVTIRLSCLTPTGKPAVKISF